MAGVLSKLRVCTSNLCVRVLHPDNQSAFHTIAACACQSLQNYRTIHVLQSHTQVCNTLSRLRLRPHWRVRNGVGGNVTGALIEVGHERLGEAHAQRAAVLRAEVAALQLELATLRGAAPRDGSATHEAAAEAAAATTKVGPEVVAGRAGSPEAPFADKAEPKAPAVAESPA